MKLYITSIFACLLVISCNNQSSELFENIKLGQDYSTFKHVVNQSKAITLITDQYDSYYRYDMGTVNYDFHARTTGNNVTYIIGWVESKKEYTPGLEFKSKIINNLSDKYGIPDTFTFCTTKENNISDKDGDSLTYCFKNYKWHKSNYDVTFSYDLEYINKPNGKLEYSLDLRTTERLQNNHTKKNDEKIKL